MGAHVPLMKYVRLGSSGTLVSCVAIGTWHLPGSGKFGSDNVEDVDQSAFNKIFKKAYDAGVNFFDTANIYHGRVEHNEEHIDRTGNSELVLGNAMNGYERESLVIATKVRGPMGNFSNAEGLSRKHIMWQIRESLKRLNTDYVDLYQIHWKDNNTSLIETMKTMGHVVDMDYARYIGESNHSTQDIIEAMYISEKYMLHPFITMQEPYNILDRIIENEKIKVAQTYHLGILAYVPLAQGILSGKYLSGSGERSRYYPQLLEYAKENEDTVRKIVEFSKGKGITPSQLAIAWLIKRSDQIGVPVIPLLGITSEKYADENLAATEINLNNEDMKDIESFWNKTG